MAWFSVTRPRSQASLSRQKLNSHIKKEKGFPTVNFRVWVDNFTHNHFTGSVCCCSGQLTAAQIHLSSEWFGLISELYDDIKPTEKHPTPPVSTTLINKIKYALIRYQFLWLIDHLFCPQRNIKWAGKSDFCYNCLNDLILFYILYFICLNY